MSDLKPKNEEKNTIFFNISTQNDLMIANYHFIVIIWLLFWNCVMCLLEKN